MKKEYIKAFLLLPFNVLITIPALILYFSGYKYNCNNWRAIIFGSILFTTGLILIIWTIKLFYSIGKGTLAPWAPPVNLVTDGPYRYIRNPMITAVLIMLLSESIILNSKMIFGWTVLFFIINAVYFPLFEEKQLKQRFGNNYIEYMNKVPRWFPKFIKKK